MSRPLISILDIETQELVVREMNDEEYAQYLIDYQKEQEHFAILAAKKAEEDAAKAALHEKLADMGITPELIEVIKKL